MLRIYAGIDLGPSRLPLPALTAEQEARLQRVIEPLAVHAELAKLKDQVAAAAAAAK